MLSKSIAIPQGYGLYWSRMKDFAQLLKFRLSFLVAFSSGFGYILATQGAINWMDLFMLCLGGFLVSGGAVTINQILEKDYDKLMSRTQDRPLATGRVRVQDAWYFVAITSVTGLLILYAYTNLLTTLLSLLSMVLYSFVYTPLKRVGSISVFVGAIPGALPPLLGWTGATGHLGYEALLIFAIQFIWQFPHFWAIAWVADEDYKKAGFKLLPMNGKRDVQSALQIMIYTLFLLPLGMLPAKLGITGFYSAIVACLCGIAFLLPTFSLIRQGSRKAALRTMYGSFLYLPIIQIAFLLDKI